MFAKTTTRVLSTKALLKTAFGPKASLASQAWRLAVPVQGKTTANFQAVTAPLQQSRTFSATMAMEGVNVKNLDATVLEKIKKDFQTIDENKDGLMQPEEFRKLLEMHDTAFTEYEIDVLTECFYSGTGARGVSFDRFLEALDLAASMSNMDKDAIAEKLGIDARGAEYILGSKTHAYTPEELDISLTHKVPEGFTNKLSFQTVKAVRYLFDLGTGWRGEIKKNNVMNRVIYLETIAAVPGMVAGVIRHFKSLRAMERDGGMLNMFLEEGTSKLASR